MTERCNRIVKEVEHRWKYSKRFSVSGWILHGFAYMGITQLEVPQSSIFTFRPLKPARVVHLKSDGSSCVGVVNSDEDV